jgi:hypothetical protein
MTDLFGIPLPFIGFLCFILAAVFVYVWPKPKKDENRGMWLNMGLHYLHPLVWVLLSMTAFLLKDYFQAAIVTAALGGLVYVFFFVLLIRNSAK